VNTHSSNSAIKASHSEQELNEWAPVCCF